ncbi:MAG: alpha/beta fold hydrolase [Deltaproteobacteria bacterium]|nr:alpha/beta fold hydrolase [Deltaproteobacteria bacterium]MBZ0219941.1 alpha/beta fold hydrolase [Deltaproteobacteria bacterium]
MAEAFVFVHGWATDSRVWDVAAKRRGGGHIMVDLPGHGGERAWDEPTLTPAIRELSVRTQGIKGAVGIGWSLGSEVLIAAYPALKERFRALILVGSTPCFVSKEDFPWGQSRALVKRMIMDMKKDPASTVERFYKLNFTDEELASPGASAFLERYRYPGPISCEGPVPGCFPSFRYGEMTKALEALYAADLRDRLKEIEVPVLLVHGEMDTVCPPGAAMYMAENIKDARLEIVKGTGHAPFITNTDSFMSVVNEFISLLE